MMRVNGVWTREGSDWYCWYPKGFFREADAVTISRKPRPFAPGTTIMMGRRFLSLSNSLKVSFRRFSGLSARS